MVDEDMRALLSRLTDYSERNNSVISKLAKDMDDLREARYKPYITTLSAFLALFVTAVGYIYNVEQRLTDGSFALQRSIQQIDSAEHINADRIKVLDNRLATRTNTMSTRWDAHNQLHKEIESDKRALTMEVLTIIKKQRDGGE